VAPPHSHNVPGFWRTVKHPIECCVNSHPLMSSHGVSPMIPLMKSRVESVKDEAGWGEHVGKWWLVSSFWAFYIVMRASFLGFPPGAQRDRAVPHFLLHWVMIPG
jgi:hypothetical protein